MRWGCCCCGVGVVFQFFQLLPTLTAVENVILPMDFYNVYRWRECKGRALELLDWAGLESRTCSGNRNHATA